MDKSSIFFTANCGVCHPGGAAMEFDRNGKRYFAGGVYGYNDQATLPAEARLDGDYGFANPATGAPTTANWAKTGVSEPDCLMCHLNQYATGPGTATHDNGLSWHKRTGALRGAIGGTYQKGFELAPTAGAGWANVTYVAGQSPPMASTVAVNYGLGLAAGTLVDQGGALAIPLGKVGNAKDSNCRGCHSTPDGKKSGRTLLPGTDVHVGKVGCTGCHPSSADGRHQIGKGDITIGSVRDDLDGGVLDCVECHVNGQNPLAPDPAASHASIPSLHFSAMKCQVCHIRHLDDDPVSPTLELPDFIIEMTSNGTQNVSSMDKYVRTNPLDPAQDLPELSGRPYRWYPTVRPYKGKLTTVKPLWTAWFGEWLDGEGDAARIRPYTLRLVRKTFTVGGAYGAGSPRDLAAFPLTPGSQIATGAPILHRKSEIRAALLALRDSVDTANTTTDNDIAVRPVMVRGEKVYFLNDADEVEFFHSIVAESHDFAVNHNTVAKRDPANPVVQPGPWGSTGCAECHSAGSAFFFGKKLVEPAQYDFLDEAGTIPNTHAGQPEYVEAWEVMGYSAFKVASLTGDRVPLVLRLFGDVRGSTVTGDGINCSSTGGTCGSTVALSSQAVLTAHPDVGRTVVAWEGCTTVSADLLTCTVDVGAASAALDGALVIGATFDVPPATPPVVTAGVELTVIGSGWGNVSGPGLNCNIGSFGACNSELAPGTVVTLTANPGPYSWLEGWVGCAPVADAPESCTVTVAGIQGVTASFADGSGGGPYSPTQSLVVRVLSGRAGSFITGPGLSCGVSDGGCRLDVPTGDTITLTAVPGSGATFVGFEGCTSTPTPTTCTVTATEPTAVIGTFSP